jgi:hypothetical protein
MFGQTHGSTKTRLTKTELQEDILRFEGRFSAKLVTAFTPLASSEDMRVRLRAKRDELAFISAALDIAAGADPEVDLLDMLTLVALGKDAMARSWSVDAHGDASRGVLEAFTSSMDDISTVAAQIISPDVAERLRQVVREWQHENPDQHDVASVRLSAYAEFRTGRASSDASGLFSMVRGAAQTADTAVLLGERALYVSQRLPFLVGMHAGLVGTALVSDLGKNLEELEQPIAAVVERSVKRASRTALLLCSGVAVVAASSWLFARVAERRLRS